MTLPCRCGRNITIYERLPLLWWRCFVTLSQSCGFYYSYYCVFFVINKPQFLLHICRYNGSLNVGVQIRVRLFNGMMQ